MPSWQDPQWPAERENFNAADVVSTYTRLIKEGNVDAFQVRSNKERMQAFRDKWINGNRGRKFYGGSSKQMLDWLQNGYQAPEVPNIGPVSDQITYQQRRLRCSEEGELQVDLAMSGFDYPYLEWTPRPATPGLIIDAVFNINSHISHQHVADFGGWIRGLVEAVTLRGYDVGLNIVMDNGRVYHGAPTISLVTCVKEQGKSFDAITWSAYLSPTGYRHLVFTTIVLCADRRGHGVDFALGHGLHGNDGLTFDPNTRLLRVTTSGHFDPKSATEQVAFALGIEMEGA